MCVCVCLCDETKTTICNTWTAFVVSLIVVVILLVEILIEKERCDLHVGHIWYERHRHNAVVLWQIQVLNVGFDIKLRLIMRDGSCHGSVSGWRMMRWRWSQAHNVWRIVLIHRNLIHHWRRWNHLWRHHLIHSCSWSVYSSSSRNHWFDGKWRIASRHLLVWLIYTIAAIDEVWVRVTARIINANAWIRRRLTALKVSLHSLMLLERSALDESIATNSANVRLKRWKLEYVEGCDVEATNLFASVSSYMQRKIVWLRESSIAV